MKNIRFIFLSTVLSIAVFSLSGCGGGAAAPNNLGTMALDFDGADTIASSDLKSIRSNLKVQEYLAGRVDGESTLAAAAQATAVSLYETIFPHKTRPPISAADKFLLKAYLNEPNNAALTSFLALVNLNRSLRSKVGQKAQGEGLKYTILSQYFLSRAKELGNHDSWVQAQLDGTQQEIDKVLEKNVPITAEEDHAAHVYFNDTFNYHEENRYVALEKLLQDIVDKPKNVYTSFTITAINLWMGGEGDYDDPTVLENFVVGSYFSIHTMNLARNLETAWLANNNATPRFRMASILGGFSAMQRRWLAKVHGGQAAIDDIDTEHREWRLIHRAFHAFTVGLSFFEEKQNFQEGLRAWQDSFAHCAEVPVRTCSNLPRLSHNFPSFVLGYVDFLLKNGDTDTAAQYLQIRHIPDQVPGMNLYTKWDLGRGAWEHREQHLAEITALYKNDDPKDDPIPFLMKRRKWGADTATCQGCHQAQGATWTEEEKRKIILPPEPVATVGVWPKVRTTWYGAQLAQK